MFDNVAFEVVIGLIFIYLLYSLLVTILSELISSWLNIRGNLLRVAIERMLNDGYYFKIAKSREFPWKHNKNQQESHHERETIQWRRGTELRERPEFRHSFAGKFFDYPAIKYLGRIEKAKEGKLTLSKPGYISAAYFAESLINFLADKGEGTTLMDKVGFCLQFNTYHIQPNTRRQFINLFETSDTLNSYKANLMKWYTETMDRTTGWYKRKLKLISFLLGLGMAIAFNVDTINIAKILAKDKEARQQLVDMGIALGKDSSRYKDFVIAGHDTIYSQTVLDSGFARVNRDINAANLVLGLGWNFEGKLKNEKQMVIASDTNTLVDLTNLKSLIKTDSITRSSLEKNMLAAVNYKQRLDSIISKRTIDSIQVRLSSMAESAGNDSKKDEDDSMLLAQARLNHAIAIAKIKMDSAALKASQQFELLLSRKIQNHFGKDLSTVDSIGPTGNDGSRIVYGKRELTFGEKFGYFVAHVFWYNLVGFLITALALSLGAPFWFDMLNKVVAIRAAGVKPEEKKENKLAEPTVMADQVIDSSPRLTPAGSSPVTDIIEAAYQEYAAAIRAIPGVKSVFTVNRKGVKVLQVNINDATTKEALTSQFGDGLKIAGITVPLLIVESGTPVSHAASGMISNKSGLNGFGSLGCVVEWKEAGTQHILSCWHVLKGDFNYAVPDVHRTIMERNDDLELAERWAGGIKAQYDYGLAECRAGIPYLGNAVLRQKLKIPAGKISFRSVSKTDVSNQIAVKFYDALLDVQTDGIIYTDSEGVAIDYHDRTRVVQDVLLLTNENEEPISRGGNSGSIVFDAANTAIAMIIGGDKNYTYAIKLSHIFKIHSEMTIA